MLKITKGIFLYLQLNKPVAFKRTPPRCIYFLKDHLAKRIQITSRRLGYKGLCLLLLQRFG